MSDISYTYSKKRKDFGRIVDFHPYDADLLCECPPNSDVRAAYVTIDPYETEVQNVPSLSEAQTNTERISLRPHGQLHSEGGWPLAIDPTEFEEKMKYCKKAERDDAYYTCCRSLVTSHMDGYLKQNNAIDIYGSYFPPTTPIAEGTAEAVPTGPPSLRITTVLKDPSAARRTAAALSWLSDGRKLAVAYCNLRFQGDTEATTASYVWDITNPNEPAETLLPSSPLCSIEYYAKDPHLIAGGSFNGVVQYWDTRQPGRPASKSLIEESHKDPVWAIKWLQSKSGELLSVSTDGQAFIWDCRTPEKPAEIRKFDAESLILQPKNNEGGAKGVLGGLCLDYDAQVGGPAKYMIGTEQGTVLSCNRKGKSMHDKIGANTFNGHHGPVYAVQRNPHHPKYFLTVGDWTARLWFEDFKVTPLYTTFYHKAHLTCGCWHPQRAGVFMTTRMDGAVDVWDLMSRQSAPVVTQQVSDYALHTLRCTVEGRHVAMGAVDGSVALVELSPSLVTPAANEKNFMGRMFENESTRDKNVEKASKERRTLQKKLRQQAGGAPSFGGSAGGGGAPTTEGTGSEEAALHEVAAAYVDEVTREAAKDEATLQAVVRQRTKCLTDISDGLEAPDR